MPNKALKTANGVIRNDRIRRITIINTIGIAILLVVVLAGLLRKSNARIAYVDTAKLFTGFVEADRINKQLEKEEKAFTDNLKVLEDSVKAIMDNMTKNYDRASRSKKKEMKDKLKEYNYKMNKYNNANKEALAKKKQEKTAKLFEKINYYMAEYGKEHGYDIIFGTTANGNILYGNENKVDITNEVISGLNERYK